MKKIVITTFCKAQNYGAMLQACALKNIIKKNNHKVDFLNYNDWVFQQYVLFRHNSLREILSSCVFLVKNIKRKSSFEKFKNAKFEFTSKCYYSAEEVKEFYPQADIYITGSDQVWNTEITGGLSDIYTLNFGDSNIKRISYAASIGVDKMKEEEKAELARKIKIIDSVSVREETAKDIVQSEMPEKDIKVVLDPVLLCTKQEWEEEIKNIKREKEKYILAYMVQEDEEYYKVVNQLSELTGLKVIHFERRKKYKNTLKSAYTKGPLEFVNYIRNAEYVVATSFHATVFSIIFNKKFWVVPHRVTGSRVINLLEKLGISNRAVESLEEFQKKNYNEEIYYEKVNNKLQELREDSIQWLIHEIEN